MKIINIIQLILILGLSNSLSIDPDPNTNDTEIEQSLLCNLCKYGCKGYCCGTVAMNDNKCQHCDYNGSCDKCKKGFILYNNECHRKHFEKKCNKCPNHMKCIKHDNKYQCVYNQTPFNTLKKCNKKCNKPYECVEKLLFNTFFYYCM